jgi:hypothetical protein
MEGKFIEVLEINSPYFNVTHWYTNYFAGCIYKLFCECTFSLFLIHTAVIFTPSCICNKHYLGSLQLYINEPRSSHHLFSCIAPKTWISESYALLSNGAWHLLFTAIYSCPFAFYYAITVECDFFLISWLF